MTVISTAAGSNGPDEHRDGHRGTPASAGAGVARPSVQAAPAGPAPSWGYVESRGSRFMGWVRRLAMYPILGVLALADAFVFWNTLVDKVQADTAWLLLFVTALSLGAIAACHEVGRVLRARHAGQHGSLAWVAVLSGLWLLLGITIAWVRANQTLVQEEVESELVDPVAAGPALTSTPVLLAALMLVLYMITGGLAMGHGYRFGDPITKAQRDMVRDRQAFVRELHRLQHERRLAEALREQRHEEVLREQRFYEGQSERTDALSQQLREASRQRNARAQKDPAATDALFPRPPEPPARDVGVPDPGPNFPTMPDPYLSGNGDDHPHGGRST